jgi:hypothetical protein
LKSTDNNYEIKDLRKKIMWMKQQKNMMKIVFEEEIFKLKQ